MANHQNVVAFQIRTFNDLFAKKEGGISLNNSSLTTSSVIASYCTMWKNNMANLYTVHF